MASQRTRPLVKPANPRRSSAKVPMMNRAKANTADNNGEENDENSSAREVIIKNCKDDEIQRDQHPTVEVWKR